jgi:hypothetical protein
MMMFLMSVCIAMIVTGFVMSPAGKDALRMLSRLLALRDERGGRPVTRSHATAAAGIARGRSFGKR